MKMKEYLTAVPFLLGGGMGIQRKPDPVREYTPEQLVLRKQIEETTILRAETKRERKAQQRKEQQERIDANMWWRKIPADQQWELIRKHWPRITWPEMRSITNGHIVYMFKQEKETI